MGDDSIFTVYPPYEPVPYYPVDTSGSGIYYPSGSSSPPQSTTGTTSGSSSTTTVPTVPSVSSPSGSSGSSYFPTSNDALLQQGAPAPAGSLTSSSSYPSSTTGGTQSLYPSPSDAGWDPSKYSNLYTGGSSYYNQTQDPARTAMVPGQTGWTLISPAVQGVSQAVYQATYPAYAAPAPAPAATPAPSHDYSSLHLSPQLLAYANATGVDPSFFTSGEWNERFGPGSPGAYLTGGEKYTPYVPDYSSLHLSPQLLAYAKATGVDPSFYINGEWNRQFGPGSPGAALTGGELYLPDYGTNLDAQQQAYARDFTIQNKGTPLDPNFYRSGEWNRQFGPGSPGAALTGGDLYLPDYGPDLDAQQRAFARDYAIHNKGTPLDPNFYRGGDWNELYGPGSQGSAYTGGDVFLPYSEGVDAINKAIGAIDQNYPSVALGFSPSDQTTGNVPFSYGLPGEHNAYWYFTQGPGAGTYNQMGTDYNTFQGAASLQNTLAAQRAAMSANVNNNPDVALQWAARLYSEDSNSSIGRQGVAEAMLNRNAAWGGDPLNPAYYPPNQTAYINAQNTLRNNPALLAQVLGELNSAFAGSNVSNLATDWVQGNSPYEDEVVANATPTWIAPRTGKDFNTFYRKDISNDWTGRPRATQIQNWYNAIEPLK